MLSKNEWLKKATLFEIGTCKYHNRRITIEKRNPHQWVLKMDYWVLGKDGEFHYEPKLPSNRNPEFIENTRFTSPDECHGFWLESVRGIKDLPHPF